MPRVSFVITAFNAARYVGEAVRSALAQTLHDLEVIVVDDGSDDDTAVVLEEIRDDRLRVLTQPNSGMASAANRAVAESRGTYVARMDADDVSWPARAERQATFLDRRTDVTVVGSSFRVVDADLNPLGIERVTLRDRELRREMYIRNPFGHGTVMFRRTAFEKIGGYNARWWPSDDFDLLRRFPGRLANIPDVLYDYRIHPTQSSVSRQGEQASVIMEEIWAASPPPVPSIVDLVTAPIRYRGSLRAYLRRQMLVDRRRIARARAG